MNWKVTYRDKSGGKAETMVEADGRANLFAILDHRGIKPISVAEASADAKPARSFQFTAMIAAGLVTAALVAVLFFLLRKGDVTPTPEQKVAGRPVAIPPAQPRTEVPAKPAEENPKPTQPETGQASEFDDGRVLTSCTTNGMYIVEMYRMPDGKKLKKYRHSVKSIWNSATDQLLHMALSTPPGVEMPPLPYSGNMTKEFKESLKTPVVVNEGDSDEVREAKERIIEAREIVRKLIDEGYTFEDIIADHEARNREDAKLRNTVRERIEEIKRDGDIDMAREYMEKANKFLRKSGIYEVHDRALDNDGNANSHKENAK